jgi:hypothetical protein
MTRSVIAGFLAVTMALAAPRVARADGPDYEEAKVHYANAEKAMTDGKYEVAAEEYGVAYDITKDAVLFLKIGNAELKAGKCDAAVVYFERYLKEGNPSSDEVKAATQEKIDGCKKGGTAATTTTTDTDTGTGTGTGSETGTGTETGTDTETGTATETDAGTGTETGTGPGSPSFLDEKPSWKKSAGWISVGASVAFLTAGAILAMSGESREEDLNALYDFRDPQDQPAAFEGNVSSRYQTLIDDGKRFNTMARISFGIAGAAAVTATIFLVLDHKQHHGAESGSAITRVTPLVTRGGGGLAASLRF